MATPKRRPLLCYSLRKESEHGYTQLYLRIFSLQPHTIASKIEGTVDNKAGYGNPDTAVHLGKWFRHLRELGNKIVLESPWTDKIPSITIRYQEYRQQDHASYCDPTIEKVGQGTYRDIQESAKFLRKLGKRIATLDALRQGEAVSDVGNWVLKNPTRVIEALENLKARRVEIYRGKHRDGWVNHESVWLIASNDRPWLLSDTLTEQFNL